MIELLVELSGENPALARAEAAAAAEALGGGRTLAPVEPPGWAGLTVELPREEAGVELAKRLALAYRLVERWPQATVAAVEGRLARLGAEGQGASFREIGHPRSAGPVELRDLFARAWTGAGGSVRLTDPPRAFWYARLPEGALWFGEERGKVDRPAMAARRMPKLPFRRPVSLPPKLGRVAANLARIRPGDRVVDPFVGTGALLAEALSLGARGSGADREVAMVRGCAVNLAHLGLAPELLRVADASEAFEPPGGGRWDALVTDPPYGRSSGSGGEPPEALLARTLPSWTDRIRPGGFLSLVVPLGTAFEPGPGFEPVDRVPDRVHRSLTREFRSYRRLPQ